MVSLGAKSSNFGAEGVILRFFVTLQISKASKLIEKTSSILIYRTENFIFVYHTSTLEIKKAIFILFSQKYGQLDEIVA